MFSTSGGVQYIWGVANTLGDAMSTSGDILNTSGDTMSTSGGIVSTSGDVQYIAGYHDACGEQVNKSLKFILKAPMY